jgi:hypothetical protein
MSVPFLGRRLGRAHFADLREFGPPAPTYDSVRHLRSELGYIVFFHDLQFRVLGDFGYTPGDLLHGL